MTIMVDFGIWLQVSTLQKALAFRPDLSKIAFFFLTSVCFFIFDDFRHRDYSPGNKIVSKSSTDNALIQETLTNGS